MLIPSVSAREFNLPEQGLHVVGELQSVVASDGDSMSAIAMRNGLGFNAVTASNPKITSIYPGENTRVTLPTRYVLPDAPRRGIVINLAELRLYYYPPDSPTVHVFPVGIGRAGWETPVAHTTVTRIDHNPVWRPPISIKNEYRRAGLTLPDVVAAGPENPLGNTAIRLALPGYLLHGTNKPQGVGMRVSHGCIRLYAPDIEQLSEMVGAGTEVRIVNQPVKWGMSSSGVVVEAYRDRLQQHSTVARAHLVEKSPALENWLHSKRREQLLFSGIPLNYTTSGPLDK